MSDGGLIITGNHEANRRLAERQDEICNMIAMHLDECERVNGAASAVRAEFLIRVSMSNRTAVYYSMIQ